LHKSVCTGPAVPIHRQDPKSGLGSSAIDPML
jgi:hypothetical protein